MAKTTTANLLTDERVEVLNAARSILKAIDNDASAAAWGAPTRYTTADDRYAQSYGRLAEAADNAAGAIFNVLNIASSHLREPLTETQIHNRSEDEGDGREPDGAREVGAGRIVSTDR